MSLVDFLFMFMFDRLPQPKNTSENNRLENEVDQQQDFPKITENESGQPPGNYITSAEINTETKPKALMLEQPSSITVKTTAARSALSLLTTFLLRDEKRLKTYSSEKLVQEKLRRSHTEMQKID